MNAPMANLPVVIFQFALSPYEDWQDLAWAGALLITVTILVINIIAAPAGGARLQRTLTIMHAECPLLRDDRRDARRRAPLRPASWSEDVGPQPRLLLRRQFGAEEHHHLPLYDRRSPPSSVRPAAASRPCCASSTGSTTSTRGSGRPARSCSTARTSSSRASTSTCCAPRSAWCSRSRRRSRCRSTTTSPSASGSTRRLPRAEMDERVEQALRKAALVERGQGQAEAERPGPVRRPAAAPVHRARDRGEARRCCCSTSRPRRSTRSRPPRSRS